MVTRIISGQSIRGLLNYNENKVAERQATLILASRFGTDINQLDFKSKLSRFENLTMLNDRVKTNALHIMLNFDRDDQVDTAAFQQIANSYMERIGFGDQPYLVYQHKDVSHPHVHIVTTNIQPNGKRIDIHGIGRTLSEAARKELEVEFNSKYWTKQLENWSWSLDNAFNLIMCNPYRSMEKRAAIENFVKILPNYSGAIDAYIVPGEAPNYVKDTVKVSWFVRDYLQEQNGIYLFEKMPNNTKQLLQCCQLFGCKISAVPSCDQYVLNNS